MIAVDIAADGSIKAIFAAKVTSLKNVLLLHTFTVYHCQKPLYDCTQNIGTMHQYDTYFGQNRRRYLTLDAKIFGATNRNTLNFSGNIFAEVNCPKVYVLKIFVFNVCYEL